MADLGSTELPPVYLRGRPGPNRRRTPMSCVKTSVLLALGIVSLLPITAWADEEHTPDDASAVVQKYVAAKIKKDGAFRFKDAQADAQLELVQDEIRMARD